MLSPQHFPSRLKAARKARQWTQPDLAKRTGLKITAVSHFECNRRSPSLENLCKLCNALDVLPSDLLK